MIKKSEFVSAIALLMVGVALLGGGVYLLKGKLDFLNQSVLTEGEVTAIETSRIKSTTYYHPVVSFIATDGTSYSFTSDIGKSAAYDYETGDSVEVRYIEQKPHLAKINGFWTLWAMPVILSGLGLILIAVGLGNCFNYFHKKKMMRELPRTGKLSKLTGRVEVREAKNKKEFVILTDWLNEADSKMYTFSSGKMPYDPTRFLADRTIDVWTDSKSPQKNHFMDLSFLPEKG
jgi:hypothetical protein